MYATIPDLVTRFGEDALLDKAHADDGTLATEAVETALADASEVVDSHVAARYLVPLTPVPAPVRRWCADIAWYYLHRYEVPPHVRKAFEDALGALKDVAKGLVTLQCVGAESPPPTAAAGGVQAAGSDRVFSSHSLKGF